ncbi:Mycobacterium numidiamassiliense ORFan [Mycobacterium numidiamassiliense]|uniref:Mycobacterium numidiamassiliense ORFan n=1 Tax=Mycobacterium numidiamassiliense TaxID=1841861 RepID=A0A2U3PIV7_9MYCO|nr:hypothetical protein [Mycobacterium numidiamassiliense]SPM43605.1 Mycobacterium numidiamassiliense ORFan [Mycobacterium numidiamassiliense]
MTDRGSADSVPTDTTIGAAAGDGTGLLPDAIRDVATPATMSKVDETEVVDDPRTGERVGEPDSLMEAGEHQPDTAVGSAAGTEILPDAIRHVESPLAWEQSDDDDDIEENPRTGEEAHEPLADEDELGDAAAQSFCWTWGYAAMFLSIALVAAVVVAAVGWAVTRGSHQTPAAAPKSSSTIPSGAESSPSTSSLSSRPLPTVAQAAPATTTVTTQAPTSQTPNPDAADNTYISIIEAAGIHLYDRGKAISAWPHGHMRIPDNRQGSGWTVRAGDCGLRRQRMDQCAIRFPGADGGTGQNS